MDSPGPAAAKGREGFLYASHNPRICQQTRGNASRPEAGRKGNTSKFNELLLLFISFKRMRAIAGEKNPVSPGITIRNHAYSLISPGKINSSGIGPGPEPARPRP